MKNHVKNFSGFINESQAEIEAVQDLIRMGLIENPRPAVVAALADSSISSMEHSVGVDLAQGRLHIGLEPDMGYHFAELEETIGKDFDLQRTPQPVLDLGIEVDFVLGTLLFRVVLEDQEYLFEDREEMLLSANERLLILDPDFAKNVVEAIDELLNTGLQYDGRQQTACYALIARIYERNRDKLRLDPDEE